MLNIIGNKWLELKSQAGRIDWEKLRPRGIHLWIGCSGLISLLLALLIINNFLQRKVVINQIKKEMHYVIASLNEAGWDLAYDQIDFNAIYPFKLATIKNLKIYNQHDSQALNIDALSFSNSLFKSQDIQINLGESQSLILDEKEHKISLGAYEFSIELPGNQTPNNLIIQMQNMVIADWADIGSLSFASRIVAPQQINGHSAFLRGHLDIRKIKLNGLLNYPLSQNIERIYVNAEVIGQIKAGGNFKQALREWLANDGKIEIKEFNLNWPPLLMVGKGDLYFNENFKPILQLYTSSKALLDVISELENRSWLDSKGAFVAKILLSNKAYKANPSDPHLTVTTPIAVRDDALLVEKIVLKKL